MSYTFEGGFMMPEIETKKPEIILLGEIGQAATGTLGEAISDERQHELVEALPRSLENVDKDEPKTCIDGSGCLQLLSGEPTNPRYRQAAGDLMTMSIGQMLIDGFHLRAIQARHPDASFQDILRAMQDEVFIAAMGRRTGAHVAAADHIKNPHTDCGCGAADKLKLITHKIAESAALEDDAVSRLTGAVMQSDFSVDVHKSKIVPSNSKLVSMLNTSNWQGKDLTDIVKSPTRDNRVDNQMGMQDIEVLDGLHGEQLAVFNFTDQTISRQLLEQLVNGRVFEVHVKSIKDDAQSFSSSDSEASELFQSMMTFQIASALTLVQPKLRAVILR